MYRFPTPRDPRVGAWDAPNTPKSPPPPKKNLVGKKNLEIFRLPPPPPPQILFVCVLRPQEDVFAKKNISVTKNFQPSEHSPQSWCNNKYSNNYCCVRYGLQPPTHLINTQCQKCLCTHHPACLSMII